MRVESRFRKLQNRLVSNFSTNITTGIVVEFGADDNNDYSKLFNRNINFVKTNICGKYEYQNLESLTLEDDSINAALCISVLQHVFNINQAISEIIRVLKPGGQCLITNGYMFPLCMEHDYFRLTPAYWRKRLENEPVSYEIINLGNIYDSIDNMLMRPYGRYNGLRNIVNKLISIPFKIIRRVIKNNDTSPLGVAVIITKNAR